MSNPVTSKTLCTRLYKCAYYKETNTYIKYIECLFNNLLLKYKKFEFKNFVDTYTSYYYSGLKYISIKDRRIYKSTCLLLAINIDKIFNIYNITNIKNQVDYKSKVIAFIDGEIENKNINIYFNYRTTTDIDFFCFNNYIYNIVTNKQNNCLICNLQNSSFIKINHNNLYYSTNRGFLRSLIDSKIKKPGDYCSTCVNSCRYEYINGLSRLNSII